jgi:hypothetical protein
MQRDRQDDLRRADSRLALVEELEVAAAVILQVKTLGGQDFGKLSFVRIRFIRNYPVFTSTGSGNTSYSIPMKAMSISTSGVDPNSKTIHYQQTEEFITARTPMGER